MFKKLIITGFIALFALTATPAFVNAQVTDADREELLEQIASLLETVRELQDELAALTGRQADIREEIRDTVALARDLAQGMTGDDVEALQELLASDPDIYPEGLVTGFYGPLTLRAVERFQERFGIEDGGRVGPDTRRFMNMLFKDFQRGPGSLNSGRGNFLDRMFVDADDIDDDVEVDDSFPGRSGHRVLVCHLGSIGETHTLAVAPQALQAHLNHGDELGRCGDDSDDDDDDDRDDDSDDDELEIEVEFEDGEAKVEIHDTDGSEENFVFDTTDEDEVIDMIVDETDLTEDEVRDAIKFEDEDEMCELDEDKEELQDDIEELLSRLDDVEDLASDEEWSDAADEVEVLSDDADDIAEALEDMDMEDEADDLQGLMDDLSSAVDDEDEDGVDEAVDDIEEILEDVLHSLEADCDDDDDDDDDDDEDDDDDDDDN